MKKLVFLLEEESAKNMLSGLVPRLVPGVQFHCFSFEGKTDLENELLRKIRLWREPDTYFIVMRDQDSGNCVEIKCRLIEIVNKSGKGDNCLIRIACHELESFFLGDLPAVARALGLPKIENLKNKSLYRVPDDISNAAEQLRKITNNQYRKLSGSKAIGTELGVDGSNLSHSFRVLCEGIKRLAS